MKKTLFSALVVLAAAVSAHAQAEDGSTCPDFTFADINGVSHNLYSELNAGRLVIVDLSATDCGNCWYYHGSGWLDTIYHRYDQPGNNTMRVWLLETGMSTTMADLQGTGPQTLGDWVTGTPYTISNLTWSEFIPVNDAFQLTVTPSIFMICPNKKMYNDTLYMPSAQVYEWVQQNKCASAAGLDNPKDANPLSVFPNPAAGKTTLYFSLQAAAPALEANLLNSAGQAVRRYPFSNLQAGDHKLDIDLGGISAGIYFLNLECEGRQVTKKLVVH